MPDGMLGRKTAPKGMMEPKVFHPTMEEFSDFMGYIKKIETEHNAHEAGICKIVPPKEWIPRRAGYDIESFNFEIDGPIKQKFNQIGSRGCYQTKGIIQPKMSVVDYKKMALSAKYATPYHKDYDDLERKYWKSLSFGPPIYGADVSNAITDADQKIWNIAKLDSILKYVGDDLETTIQGVNSPYLYFGMWKATFSWHVEDMDLYAINMVHHGAPKTWYCVPPKYGHLLERACRQLFPNVSSWCSNFMRHKTCLIAPNVLDKYGVPFQKVTQEEREIIITFPYGYHSGFNHGFNIAESTNFATERWIEYGKRQRPCDCDRARVKFSMDLFVKRFQPDKYEAWLANEDIAPHPEDPPDVAREVMLRAENPAEYARQLEEKIRKVEEKRLKKIEQQQQKQKVDSPAPVKEEAESFTQVDVYRHIDLARIEVEIFPKSFKIHRGKQALEDLLQRTDYDVKELIEKGVLYKVADRKINRQKRKATNADNESEQNYIVEKRRVAMYKHVALEGINITVDPVTKELVNEPSEKLVEFLQMSNEPVKTLIDIGVFEKICDALLEITKMEKIPVAEQPAQKKQKLDIMENVQSWPKVEEVAAKQATPKNIEVYRHRESGDHFTVSALRKKLIGRMTEQKQQLLGDRPVVDLIDEGILVYVGNRKMRELVQNHSSSSQNAIKRGVFAMKTAVASEAEAGTGTKIEVASDGLRSIYSFDTNSGVLSKLSRFNPASHLTMIAKENECSVPIQAVMAMLNPDLSIKPCETHVVSESSCNFCKLGSKLQNLKPVCQSLNVPIAEVKCGFDLTAGYLYLSEQQKTHLVKFETVPQSMFLYTKESSASSSSPKKPEPKKEIDESAEYYDDDDEEDNFTTDESSESNDESSDDPDYYGSGSVKEWKSSARMNKKLKKRQKRLERLERRNNRKSRGSTDTRRMAKISDEANALLELTKKMLAMTFELGQKLQMEELIKNLEDERGRILAVLRIFRGFKIVTMVPGEDGHHQYIWEGKNDDAIKETLWSILENREAESTESADVLWYICCDVLRTLLSSRKETRVFLQLIKKVFAIDEPRRISNSAAILEGLGLVEKWTADDGLGGVVYKGPFIFDDFIAKSFTKYASDFSLKELQLKLEPIQFEEQHLYQLRPPTFQLKPFDDEDLDQLDEDMKRAYLNKDKVCKCGSTMAMKDGGVMIERDGHKDHMRKNVYVGGQRKRRCKRCSGCLAPRCKQCIFCLNPRMKKPCQNTICKFPIVPNCPCFA